MPVQSTKGLLSFWERSFLRSRQRELADPRQQKSKAESQVGITGQSITGYGAVIIITG